jgi:hypothetical protein
MRILKKSSGILCKGNRLAEYRFIRENYHEFGVRWLLNKFNIYPNAYYNFLKNRKGNYNAQKSLIHDRIEEIYHDNNGVFGYRQIKRMLEKEDIVLSYKTVHKYMNKDLALYSIVRRKKPNYLRGKKHKVHDNLLKQDFTATKQTWPFKSY